MDRTFEVPLELLLVLGLACRAAPVLLGIVEQLDLPLEQLVLDPAQSG